MKKFFEKLGNITGGAIHGTAKGLYKGVTNQTDEVLQHKADVSLLKNRILSDEKDRLSSALLISKMILLIIALYFSIKSDFDSDKLIMIFNAEGLLVLIPVVLYFLAYCIIKLIKVYNMIQMITFLYIAG